MSEWIEWKWTAEKPYPETLDTKVAVWFTDGYNDEKFNTVWSVKNWRGPNDLSSCWNPNAGDIHIIAYKVVTE